MEVEQDTEQFREDALYLDEHREELLGRYPEKWVAVYNRQVVAAAKDLYLIPKKAGHYRLFCPDHDWAGMTGEITVE